MAFDNKKYQKRYREKYKDRLREYQKQYKAEHKDEIKASSKKYYENNKEDQKVYSKKYYRQHIKECKEYGEKYIVGHKEDKKKYDRKYRAVFLKKRYNLSIEQYNELFKKQRGRCAICFKVQQDKMLAVDHDHRCCPGAKSCGKCIRGLLCNNCNWVLGLINESPIVLKEIQRYLKIWNERGTK